MFIKSNNRGDTIVEVIVCIAVISLILSAAYSISTRSLNGMRIAQERGEALKVAEGQMEMLRKKFSLITSPSDPSLADLATDMGPPPLPTATCIKPDLSVVRFTLPGNDIMKTDNYAASAPDCIVNDRYNIALQSQVSLPAPPLHTQVEIIMWINVIWERSGGGVEKLTMVYKATP